MFDNPVALKNNIRILVIRTDRLGDLVLSLPVFASIRKALPEAYICSLTREYTLELVTGRDDINDVITFDSPTAHVPAGEFLRLKNEIRSRKFDAAILLYSNFSVALLTAMARVPVRIGPAAKIAQVFLTHRISQRRSKGEKHEADYNLDLLKPLNIPAARTASITASVGASPVFVKKDGRPLIGIHPGSGGSSRNWPESRYVELICKLIDENVDVAVTGSESEKMMLERIVKTTGRRVQIYIGRNGLGELITALSSFDAFVAPSTGPLHIASALGVPVVGLYCPIFVCLPQRWGPIGAGNVAVTPPDTPTCDRCVQEKCPEFDCMEKIDVETVKNLALSGIKSTVSP